LAFLCLDFADGSGENSHYTLFVTYAYTGDRPYPLILLLHGFGDAGMEGDQYLKVGLPPAIQARKESFRFIAVIPQGHSGQWSPGSWDAKRALAILDRVEKEYRVDRVRVYLTGLSSGGSAVWEWAARNPDRWAAIVPISSAGCDPELIPRFRHIPCWCFHNVNDKRYPPTEARATIAALRAAGGRPRYTERFYPANTAPERHNAWDAAYGAPDLYAWLLQHRLPREPSRDDRSQDN
jgi:predicted peptidase